MTVLRPCSILVTEDSQIPPKRNQPHALFLNQAGNSAMVQYHAKAHQRQLYTYTLYTEKTNTAGYKRLEGGGREKGKPVEATKEKGKQAPIDVHTARTNARQKTICRLSSAPQLHGMYICIYMTRIYTLGWSCAMIGKPHITAKSHNAKEHQII